MKLIGALEMAEACGLETVAEAIFNIRLHAASLFSWSNCAFEVTELLIEWRNIREATEFEPSSSVRDVLAWLKKESV